MAQIGTHCMIELHECPPDLINDEIFVSQALREATARANATLLHEVVHKFEPQGVTALGLLADSHISIHTWPEHGYAAADIFTCGEEAMPEAACRYLAGAFRAKRPVMVRTKRGQARHELEPFGMEAVVTPAPSSQTAVAQVKEPEEPCPAPRYAQITG